jgi:pimeloyl-ACP methyl ester carboxylesterase
MWRWVRRILTGLVGLLVIGALGGATYQSVATRRDLAATPPPGNLVDVGGYRLHIWCRGSGTPAVILDAGLGDTAFVWNAVQDGVAEFAQVCSYDRAGVGYSDASPAPRTSAQIAKELAELLERSGINDPVILVGASLGGLNMRVFASEYPLRTAGLVLVDASHENQRLDLPQFASLVPAVGALGLLRLLGVSLGPNPHNAPEPVRRFERATAFRTSRYRALHDELVNIPDSAAQVRATRRTLSIPLVVVTSGRGNQDATWRAFQQDQVQLSARSCQVIAEQSGHVIARGQPEAVVNAIRATLDAARLGSTPACG